MKKLLIAILFVLVTVSGWCAGTTTDDRTGQDVVGLSKVGIGTSTPAVAFVNTGFSQLGELATPLKCVIFNVTASSTAGAVTLAPHGMTGSKIVSISARLADGSGEFNPSNDWPAGQVEYLVSWNATNFIVSTTAANSSAVLGKVITITAWYIP